MNKATRKKRATAIPKEAAQQVLQDVQLRENVTPVRREEILFPVELARRSFVGTSIRNSSAVQSLFISILKRMERKLTEIIGWMREEFHTTMSSVQVETTGIVNSKEIEVGPTVQTEVGSKATTGRDYNFAKWRRIVAAHREGIGLRK